MAARSGIKGNRHLFMGLSVQLAGGRGKVAMDAQVNFPAGRGVCSCGMPQGRSPAKENRMNRIGRMARAWAGLVCVAATTAGAEEPVATLPEVVVTAMRAETAMADVPYAGHVIGRADLQDAAPRTTPDALAGPAVGDGPENGLWAGLTLSARVHGLPDADDGGRHPAEQLHCSAMGPTSIGTRSIAWSVDALRGRHGAGVGAVRQRRGGRRGERARDPGAAGMDRPTGVGAHAGGTRGATADESHQTRAGDARPGNRATRVSRPESTWKKFNDVRGGADTWACSGTRATTRSISTCARTTACGSGASVDAGPPAGGPGRRVAHAQHALRRRLVGAQNAGDDPEAFLRPGPGADLLAAGGRRTGRGRWPRTA
jgi:hypothetical protein